MSLEIQPTRQGDRTITRGGDRAAWTISEWCKRRNISRALFYKLKKAGKAPRIKYAGSKPLITAEADAEWAAAT
jgi:hypothetical protein